MPDPEGKYRLSEVLDELFLAEYPQQTITLVRQDLFRRYPKIEAEAYAASLGVQMNDPVVPTAWATTILEIVDRREDYPFMEIA